MELLQKTTVAIIGLAWPFICTIMKDDGADLLLPSLFYNFMDFFPFLVKNFKDLKYTYASAPNWWLYLQLRPLSHILFASLVTIGKALRFGIMEKKSIMKKRTKEKRALLQDKNEKQLTPLKITIEHYLLHIFPI